MGVASGCGEQEVGVASGSGWNLWVWLLGVVLRRYIRRFPHTTYPYSSCICTFCSSIPTFLFIFLNVFRSLILWLHSLSGVIRSLLCKPCAFSPAMITYTPADHRRMRLRGNVYRSSITDVKRRYTKHCNVNKMADSSGVGPGKFITLLTL